MAALAVAAPYIAAGLSVYSTVAGGYAAKDAGKLNAQALRAKGISDEAIAQHQAEQTRRQTAYLQSRAQAVAAASGAGASDKTVLDVQGAIEKEGEFNALAQLWEGANSRANYNYAAQVARQEGNQASKNANVMALAQAITFGAGQYALHQGPNAVPGDITPTPTAPDVTDISKISDSPDYMGGMEKYMTPLSSEHQAAVQDVIGKIAPPTRVVENLNPVKQVPPSKPPLAPTPGVAPKVAEILSTGPSLAAKYRGSPGTGLITDEPNNVFSMRPAVKELSPLEQLAKGLEEISKPKDMSPFRGFPAKQQNRGLSLRDKYGKE